jgi:periplasmic protein TonB
MRGVFEFTGFTALALALHVAAFQGLPQGSESAGSGGDAVVTVAAVSGSLSEMVATWDRPPAVSAVVPAALPQPTVDHAATAATSSPAIEPPVTQPPPRLTPVLPLREAAVPQDATQSAPPLPAQQVDVPPTIRPQARPASQAAKAKPAKPTVSQTPRAATTAAGSGATAERGTRGPAETATLNQGARQTLMAEWGGKIRNRIDAAKPRGGGQGSVTVLLTVGRNGNLQSVGVAATSGQGNLDQRALQAVKSAGQFPAAPSGLTDASYSFRLPIRFD